MIFGRYLDFENIDTLEKLEDEIKSRKGWTSEKITENDVELLALDIHFTI